MKKYRVTMGGRNRSGYGYYYNRSSEDYQKFQDNFIKVANKVVELGGVICYGKNELDNEYRFWGDRFEVKLPDGAELELRKMPEDILNKLDFIK